jgi:hypothetical protein
LRINKSQANCDIVASPEKQLTFFENVLPTLKEPLFTANLKHGEPGNYNFGYIDPTEYTGVIGWAPVTFPYGYPAYWQLDFTGFQVGATPYVERLINGIAGECSSRYLYRYKSF